MAESCTNWRAGDPTAHQDCPIRGRSSGRAGVGRLRKLVSAASFLVMAPAANLSTLLALARAVFGHTSEAFWVTIPVGNLGAGEEFSPLAQRGFESALRDVKARADSCGDHKASVL